MGVDSLEQRAAVHRLLGDERRLAIVDELRRSDRTPSELAALSDMSSNLLAHHLAELEGAGLVRRVQSEGDRRRRYVQLALDPLTLLGAAEPCPVDGPVLFVCTHNAARSQLAAALWNHRTGRHAISAGTQPAPRVAPGAVRVARRHGLALEGRTPQHLGQVAGPFGLVVTVCDRAREDDALPQPPDRHWSVPDPVGGPARGYKDAFNHIAERIDHLATEVVA